MQPRAAIIVTSLLFVVSLVLPAVDFVRSTLRGYEAIVVGMIAAPGWANIAGCVSMIALGKGRFPLGFHAGLVALALAVLPIPIVLLSAGSAAELIHEFPLHSGYFLWIACLLVLTHANWKNYQSDRGNEGA